MDQKILDKVRKCLALSKSANSNEAAQALKHAKALMDKHGITSDYLETMQITASGAIKYSGKKSLDLTDELLICAVTNIFCVTAAFRSVEDGKTGSYIIFIGHEADIVLASYAMDTLRRLLIQAKRTYLNKLQNSFEYKWLCDDKSKQRMMDSFCRGWILGVHEQAEHLARYKDVELTKHQETINKFVKQGGESKKYEKNKTKFEQQKLAIITIEESLAAQDGIRSGMSVKLYTGLQATESDNLLITQNIPGST